MSQHTSPEVRPVQRRERAAAPSSSSSGTALGPTSGAAPAMGFGPSGATSGRELRAAPDLRAASGAAAADVNGGSGGGGKAVQRMLVQKHDSPEEAAARGRVSTLIHQAGAEARAGSDDALQALIGELSNAVGGSGAVYDITPVPPAMARELMARAEQEVPPTPGQVAVRAAGGRAAAERAGYQRVMSMIDDPTLTPEQHTQLAADLHRAGANQAQDDQARRRQAASIRATVLGEVVTLARSDLPALIAAAERVPEGPEPTPGPLPIGQGRSPEEALPVDLQSLSVAFTLPAGSEIDRNAERVVRTNADTQVTISVTTQGINVTMAPAVSIQPLADTTSFGGLFMAVLPSYELQGISYDFASASTHVSGSGTVIGGHVQASLAQLVSSAVRHTAMARPGYNPVRDAHLRSTIAQIQANFAALPQSPGSDNNLRPPLERPSLSATFALRSAIQDGNEHVGVRIAGGASFTASVQLGGEARQIAGEQTRQAMANHIESVAITGDGVDVVIDGDTMLRLNRVEVSGGRVRVTQLRVVSSRARNIGVLVSMFGHLMQGSPRPIAELQGQAEGPELVEGLSVAVVNGFLNDAVRNLISQNRGAISGVDLGEVFHLAPQPTAP